MKKLRKENRQIFNACVKAGLFWTTHEVHNKIYTERESQDTVNELLQARESVYLTNSIVAILAFRFIGFIVICEQRKCDLSLIQ